MISKKEAAMRPPLFLALLMVPAFTGPASAQPYRVQPRRLVDYWYQRFLDRPANDEGAGAWVDDLRQGESPQKVLATILSSEEYFQKSGSTNRGFVANLYRDLAGRSPSPREVDHWHTEPVSATARTLHTPYSCASRTAGIQDTKGQDTRN